MEHVDFAELPFADEGGHGFSGADAGVPELALEPLIPESLPEPAKGEYADEFRQLSFWGVVKRVFSDSQNNEDGVVLRGFSLEEFFNPAKRALTSMPRFFLAELLAGGNLALSVRSSPEAAQFVAWYLKRANDEWLRAPCIYYRCLVDQTDGVAPTPSQLREIIQAAKTYLKDSPEGHKLACIVDYGTHGASRTILRTKVRRYLQNNNVDEKSGVKDAISNLLAALEGRLRRECPPDDEPYYHTSDLQIPACSGSSSTTATQP